MRMTSIFSVKNLLTVSCLCLGIEANAQQQVTVTRPWLEVFPVNSLYAPNGFDDDGENWIVGASGQTPGNPGDFLMSAHMTGMPATTYFTTVNVSGILATDSFSFDYRYFDGFSTSAPVAGSGYFKVFISNNQGTSYTQIDSVSNNTIGSWYTKKYALANYVGQTLKFKIESFWSSTNEILIGFDNMAVNGAVPCTNPPVVNLGSDTAICVGESFTLDAGNTGATYIWSNASTGQTLLVDGAGTYIVKVTTGANCSSFDTIVVTETPLPTVDGISSTGTSPNYSFSANNAANADTYTWDFGDNNTATGTTATHTYSTNGTYIVTLTVSNECGDTSVTDTIEVSGVGLKQTRLGEQITVYPNPVKDVLTIENKSHYQLQQVVITNILGQQVLETKVNAAANTVNTSQLANGLYNMKIIFSEGEVNWKLNVVK